MELSRVVEILQDGKSRGSGYLITPRHVLTARHVPKPSEVGTVCSIHPLCDARGAPVSTVRPSPMPAKVRWVCEGHDFAVVEITGDPLKGIPENLIGFGVVPFDGKPRRCLGSGFPEAAGDDQRTIAGWLTWVLTQIPRFDVDVTSGPPREWRKWAGFSGAPIFADNMLVGVVRSVDGNWDGRVLEATPIEHLIGDGDFSEFLTRAGLPPPKPIEARAGDIESLHDYTKSVYLRACGDSALPLDFDAEGSTTGTLRFSPRNPRVPFVGRESELAALDAFLTERPASFAWWLVSGSGGAGKTRLARQLCLRAHVNGWRAGFLPNGWKPDVASLDAWTATMPTLIVADYVLKRVADIRTLAARLARRADLRRPVRLLLLEREADELSRDFLGSDQSDRGVIEGACYSKTPLAVPELSEQDIWSLVESCPWRDDGMHLDVNRDEFLARFRSLDSQHRALVAMILADALATSPRTGLESLEAELRDLLRRDREHMWPAVLQVQGRAIGTTDADIAIAFATMLDSLGRVEAEAIAAEGGNPLNLEILPACGQAIGKPFRGQPLLGRLEPDLIGEFFVLEALLGDPNSFVETPQWMPRIAWRIHGSAMADFVARATQNFPNHMSIQHIAITVAGVWESWKLEALRVVRKAGELADGYADALEELLEAARSDRGAALALADLTFRMTLPDTNLRKLPQVATSLDALKDLCGAYPDEPELHEKWAYGVCNVMNRAADDPNGYRSLLDALAALHRGHDDEPGLREAWAFGVTNFMNHRTADDPDGCRALLDALAALHRAHDDEPALRETWARGVTIFTAARAADDPDGCRALLDALAALHRARDDEPVLRKAWAWGIRNFIAGRAADDPNGCRALLDALAALHRAHDDEPALREEWAGAVVNFIRGRAADDPDGCRALLDALAALHRARDDEPELRKAWAWGVRNFIAGRAADDPESCRALLDALAALHHAHNDEPALRAAWAWGVTKSITYRAADDPVGCRALLDALAALHRAHDDEPVLREMWAGGAVNFIVGRTADDPDGCRALLDALAALHRARDDEPVLRAAWAWGVRNFIAGRA